MHILTGAVALVGLVALLNLLLTLALIRRIRQMGASAGPSVPVDGDLEEFTAGTPIPTFESTSLEGERVASDDHIGQETVYAFFDTACSVCKTRLTPLVEHAQARGMRPEQVVVVIGHSQGDSSEYTVPLEGHATVIVEEPLGEVAQAFSVEGFPTFVHADSRGRIVRSGVDVNILPLPAR